ncbi:3D-(3,5/4)-trihydroxycyclohexane-1,2-dione acylhydrolase (decyclizing) [Ahrensia sp. R2A130]|uniref:3D-(3,5/4)-trihydroxycyclohexane-1,2-dione acylhydrolase (decyclizing) n=1 Tax=Ahrensia sp. R2A130 TaxID=744979 RepID=UPI0001E0F090|nr:3D-(3,5/4)-trihydroxycyclohexane-1,2-dione acylhydrolase (decyclizing) [Ahrensia sp. R2A130]EFL89887.1 3D-(3,5/4)-trihydroxycyclohexane-1,2-dione hydrolase [Ahrensia sp. R2A130]
MTKTIRLTAAQALVRYCANQLVEIDGERLPFLAACWGIFGHGNVAGMGEALYAHRDALPTYRGHNEQTMAHAAIAYAKASNRNRAMMVTTSIGPGATNVVTAAALAHVNRLPLLIVPGDVFADRLPDPVLQQVENFSDGTVSANDCFRPVSRYFDRITRPQQLLRALPRAFRTMTDPADCGPVTLAFCQDTQAEAYDFPVSFFEPRVLHFRRPPPEKAQIEAAIALLANAKAPMIVAGGGVHYSGATEILDTVAATHHIPVAETQAGKAALAWSHSCNLGPIGVTGGTAANDMAAKADVVIAVGTRMQDFTTGSWSLFKHPDVKFITINAASYDAGKAGALAIVSDAREGLQALHDALGVAGATGDGYDDVRSAWDDAVDNVTAPPSGDGNSLPTDMQVVGAVQRASNDSTIIVGAAGTMPGEMHKLFRAPAVGSYHMEYGFSCMGYEVAAGLGVKLARPDADVIVMVGDGSYMMGNSELAAAVTMGVPFTLVITDNRGFGCINRLQAGTGGAAFNNLLDDSFHVNDSAIDFVAHAASMGAAAVKVSTIAELESALADRAGDIPKVIVIDTDAGPSTEAGGSWWDVGVPEVSDRKEVQQARAEYEANEADERKIPV